tara:strand:+ start:283 stop:537 length:255 start_codon:yes stop_codon:yes gene_type:complete
MHESWVSKTQVCKHFGISTKTLERRFYPITTKGIHYITKDPLNDDSQRIWKLSEVEKLVKKSTGALQRRLAKKQAALLKKQSDG